MGDIAKVLVYNLAIVAIFAILAYFFNHWWIVLLSLLFTMSHTEDIIPIEAEEEEEEQEDEDNNE